MNTYKLEISVTDKQLQALNILMEHEGHDDVTQYLSEKAKRIVHNCIEEALYIKRNYQIETPERELVNNVKELCELLRQQYVKPVHMELSQTYFDQQVKE